MAVRYEPTRREFLQISGAAALATIAGADFGRRFTQEERRTLLEVVRTLFPHEGVCDEPYAAAVHAIETRCSVDAAAFNQISSGVARLDRRSGGRFAAANQQKRIKLLKAGQEDAFFRIVYREALKALYDSPHMWRMFLGELSGVVA